MPLAESISPDFPFVSKFVEVLGSRIHYVEQGEGDPVLFLHGNPTSSYLWRNIIPYVSPVARAIVPDLIGMGRSDKPDLEYRFFDHSKYVEGFIETLGLERMTLVIHDWGSALGFHYARRHESNVKGLAFMEAILRPARIRDLPGKFRIGFKLFRTPGIGWFMISAMNMFVNGILPEATVRDFTDEEMKRYREPFPTAGSRKPVRQWPCEIPFDGHPADVHEVVETYSQWLQQTGIPKLFFHATPGGLNPAPMVEWVKQNFGNLTTVDIGEGIHYVQEDQPHRIGRGLADWYESLS